MHHGATVDAQSIACLGHAYAAWRRAILHWCTLLCATSIDALAAPPSPCKILRWGGRKVEVSPTGWAPRRTLSQPPVWGTSTLRGGVPFCIGVHQYVLHPLTHLRHPRLPARFCDVGAARWRCPPPAGRCGGRSVNRLFGARLRCVEACHFALVYTNMCFIY